MTYETFDLFANELKPGAKAEQVKNSLAKHFNTSPEKLDAFFRRLLNSKEPEKIQKGLNLETAQKNKKIIENLGLICDIVPALALTSVKEEEEEEEEKYQCPACGHKQSLSVDNSDICEACGIVGRKYLDKNNNSKILKQEVQRYNRLKKLREQHQQKQDEINDRENKIREIRKNLEKKDRRAISHPFSLGAIAITACGILALQFYNEYAVVTPDITEAKSTSIQTSAEVGTESQAASTKTISGLTQDQAVAQLDQLHQALPPVDSYPSSNQKSLTSEKTLNIKGADTSYPSGPSLVTADTQFQLSSTEQNASQMEVNYDTAAKITSRKTPVDMGLETPVVPVNNRSGLHQSKTVAKIDQLQQALPSTDDYLSSNQDFLTNVEALSATTGATPDIASIELSQITADTPFQLNQSMRKIADANSPSSSMEKKASQVQNNEVDQSEDIAESIDNPHKRTLALINLFQAKLTLGDSMGAKSVLNKAVQVADAIVSPIEQIKSYGLIATAFNEMKDSSSTQRVFDKALALANRLADPVDRVSSLAIVGGYQTASGNKEAARKSFKLAQSFTVKNITNPEIRNTAYQVIALNRAINADFQEALSTADRITHPLMRTGIIKKLADIQSTLGQKDEAKRTYSRALENSVHIPNASQRRRMLDEIIVALENSDTQTPLSTTDR